MCPWLPAEFFHDFLEAWSLAMGEPYELLLNLKASGPSQGQIRNGSDPLSVGEVDAGIICAPTYLWAANHRPARVQLAGWTPVFEDVNEPIYHSYVLVSANSEHTTLENLRTARWAFNDSCSQSGYFSVLTAFPGDTEELAEKSIFSGGHMQSLEALAQGRVDACAVDSNGWLINKELRERYKDKVRVLTKLGPFPAQPIVLSSSLSQDRTRKLTSALGHIIEDTDLLSKLREKYDLVRFVKTQSTHFENLGDPLQG